MLLCNVGFLCNVRFLDPCVSLKGSPLTGGLIGQQSQFWLILPAVICFFSKLRKCQNTWAKM